MNKQYAPLAEKITYKFKRDDKKILAYVRHKGDELPKVLLYCQKCGHIHLVEYSKNRHNRYNDGTYRSTSRTVERHCIADKFKCPNCGYTAEVSSIPYSIDYPDQAIIFKMTDGSMAISLIEEHLVLYITDGGQIIHRKRKLRHRIIFSSNGQTYVKDPVWIKSGRPVIRGKRTAMIKNFTYCIDYVNSSMNYMLHELESKGLLPKYMNIRNRFRNLSDRAIKELVTVMWYEDKKGTYLCKLPRSFADFHKKIAKDINDEMLWNLIIKKLPAPLSGKRFRQELYANPIRTYFATKLFTSIKMHDPNSLYKFIRNGFILMKNGLVPDERYPLDNNIEFLTEYMKKFGEQAAADVLASKDKIAIFKDTQHMAYDLSYCFDEEYEPYMCRNVKKMHDAILNRKKYLESLGQERKAIQVILQNDNSLRETTNKDTIRCIKEYALETYERIHNNDIKYSKTERKLEDNINDINFYLPENTDHLIDAGERLHNCVGSCYRIPALHKDCIIVLMKQEDKFVGCIEINEGKIRQAFGPCNKLMSGSILEAFETWKKKNGLNSGNENRVLAPGHKKYQYDLTLYDDIVEKMKKRAEVLGLYIRSTVQQRKFIAATPF